MIHSIDLTHPDLSMRSGHLKMGGMNPQGIEISATSRFLTINGRPWLPVMGEFHFSRYPQEGWRTELLKMKAGGIGIVATYIFWIHHEEAEGEWDWSGQRDLRRFVMECGDAGLLAYPRIGPWAHGECRNGGFPDWLLKKCGGAVRQDAEPYLSYVRRLYTQIARQLEGLLWKDGGAVIGVQLENELIHGADHIRTLKRLAQEAGMEVPLYTMTGWGPAEVPQDEVIPLFGGYPDAFWVRQVEDWARECRRQYVFSPGRNDDLIGEDLLPRREVGDLSYLERYPYLTCELGGGMQVSYHRRPFIAPDDVAAPLITKLGSGSNLPGYYMYHGGTNPAGKYTTLQESQATGYPNDLPVLSYDFQAPLGEFGQIRGQYHALRLVHLFLQDFGEDLAPLPANFPERLPSSLDDCETLRWAVRSDGRRGLIFFNNYQRVEGLPDKPGVQILLRLKEENLILPSEPVTIRQGAAMFWPFHFDLDGIQLKYATAQPVCRLKMEDGYCFVFARRGGVEAEFAFSDGVKARTAAGVELTVRGGCLRGLPPGEWVLIRDERGQSARILLLDEEQALHCWKARIWGAERLFLSPAGLIFDGEELRLHARTPEELTFAVFPPIPDPSGQGGMEGCFQRFTLRQSWRNVEVACRRVRLAAPARAVPVGPAGVAQASEDEAFDRGEVWEVTLPEEALEGWREVYLRVDYVGDVARAYVNGRLVVDHFYNGQVWEIGLRRFAPEVLKHGLRLVFLPLRADAPIYLAPEHRPNFEGRSEVLEVRRITAQGEVEKVFQAGVWA